MSWLQASDYQTVIKGAVFTELTTTDGTREPMAQNYATGFVGGYINTRYNMAAMLQGTTAQYPVLAQLMIAVSLYKMYASIDPKFIPAQREKEYNEARETLRMIANGEMNMALPPNSWPPVITEQGIAETGFRFGGDEAQVMRY
jgi:Protein of unknown function (DUF1320)